MNYKLPTIHDIHEKCRQGIKLNPVDEFVNVWFDWQDPEFTEYLQRAVDYIISHAIASTNAPQP